LGSSSGQLQTSTTTDAATIRVAAVSRTFPNGITAVDSLSLDIAVGSFVALIGPSGCGKSTLLRMLAGLDVPTAGTIAGIDRNRIGYVFQDAHLLPWRSVLRNVMLPLELSGMAKAQRIALATESLSRVGLSDSLRRYPAELSGGMRMRVSLARALVTNPNVLLLDEPFAALDEISRQRLDEMLRELWLATRMTIVFVTHSIAEATFLADRAIVFSTRPARIMLDSRIDLPLDRTNELRTTTEFARVQNGLFHALQGGEAMA
jgi:NitT/TauT family transport system ATP-binding protein